MTITLQMEHYNVNNYGGKGQHIIAQTYSDLIVVYQAYNKNIADYAIKNQALGGPEYSFNRMSWIKPNFLWMMFRSGWAQKEGQEKILAFWITQEFFDTILDEAVVSTFNSAVYKDMTEWKTDLNSKEVRLQWDPDHDPYGKSIERRALQLGLKGKILKDFATENIHHVEDITPFALEQYVHVKNRELDKLMVPAERVYKPQSIPLCKKIEID